MGNFLKNNRMSDAGTSGQNLTCGLAGYRIMVDQIISLALVILTMGISLGQTTLDLMTLTDLSKAIGLVYKFLKGTWGWIGYVVAAIYYFGFDLGYAEYLCAAMQFAILSSTGSMLSSPSARLTLHERS